MEKSDINTYSKTDLHYVDVIGNYVKNSRISQNKTQQELSESAGINRATLVQLENGKPINLISLIQILRSLKKLDIFAEMELKPQISPLKLAAIEQQQRQRVRKKTKVTVKKPASDW